jgi:hypothetical protein
MYLSTDLFWLAPLLKMRSGRVIGLAFGSDILRRDRKRDRRLRFGLKHLDAVAATNDNVMKVMLDDFAFLSKTEHKIIRFGLPVLDEIRALVGQGVDSIEARRRLGYTPARCLVSLGYAAWPGQRQLDLIKAFTDRIDEFHGYDFVVPIQYGSATLMEQIETACRLANKRIGSTRFHPLSDFHDPAQAALMRLATDVLINHSVSDAFSGTVQEVIYAGKLVIAPDYLPYANMPGFGTAIRSYADLDQGIGYLDTRAITEWKDVASKAWETNRLAIDAVSSWSAVLPAWRNLIAPESRTRKV